MDMVNTSGAHQEETHDTRKKSFRRSWASSQPVARLTVVFAGIAALSTVVYTFVAGWQLYIIKSSQDETTQQMRAAIGNINWMAKNTDGSLRKLSKQVDDTHDLAVATAKQADATKLLGDATKSQKDVLAKQTDAMKSGQLMQDRPWIELVNIDVEGPLTFNVNGMNFTFVFNLKNTGHAPALNVNIDPVMYNSGVRRTNSEADEMQRSACASGRRVALSYASDTLFPDRPLIQGIKATVSAEEIRKSVVKNFVYPQLTGCITYLDPSDKSVHQTGFSFDIVGVDPITHGWAALRTDQGDIPVGSYAIRRNSIAVGGAFAN